MLADEVTHTEDGQRLVAQGHRARSRAAQAGARVPGRGRQDLRLRRAHAATARSRPVGLARRFRELAGFADDEVQEMAGGEPGGARRAQGRGHAHAGGVPAMASSTHMTVTVTPDTFQFVSFDAALIGPRGREPRGRARRDRPASGGDAPSTRPRRSRISLDLGNLDGGVGPERCVRGHRRAPRCERRPRPPR